MTETLDAVDRGLLHALQIDGRVPFARLASMLGVSEQTVARRYQRLRAAGVVKVIGLVDPAGLGESSWIVRIQSRPDAVLPLAEALTRRDDVGWVSLTSGGSEIVCVARSRTSADRDDLLLQRLPRTTRVTGFAAHAMLHRFASDDTWAPLRGVLTPEQVAELGASPTARRVHAPRPVPSGPTELAALTVEDERVIAELTLDGRAPVARLATAAGWTQPRTARRLADLVARGALYVDAEVAIGVLGHRAQAFLWLTVAPGELTATGTALSGHDEALFVAATSGPANLVVSVGCRDTAHLFRYVTEGLGGFPAIRDLEVSPFLRRLKQGGSRLAGDRIAL